MKTTMSAFLNMIWESYYSYSIYLTTQLIPYLSWKYLE